MIQQQQHTKTQTQIVIPTFYPFSFKLTELTQHSTTMVMLIRCSCFFARPRFSQPQFYGNNTKPLLPGQFFFFLFCTSSSNGFQNRNFRHAWALKTLFLCLWVWEICDKIQFFFNESGKLAFLSLKPDKGVPHFEDTLDGSSKISCLLHCSKCKVWWWVTAFLPLCTLKINVSAKYGSFKINVIAKYGIYMFFFLLLEKLTMWILFCTLNFSLFWSLLYVGIMW